MSVAEISDPKPVTIDDMQDEWNLSVRTYNVLKREGVTTLDRLTFLTEKQLLDMRMLGSKGTEEIIRNLHKSGYKLAGYIPFRDVIIPGLREGYQASREGVVLSPKGHELKPGLTNNRLYVSARRGDKWDKIPLAVMVLSAYYGHQEGQEPTFLDDNPQNCHLDNLQWSESPVKKTRGRTRTRINGTPRKSPEPRRVTRPGTLAPRRGDVEVYRTYISDEVMAAVSDDGSGSVSVGGTTLSLTAHQLRSLTLVASRIAEVNSLMGIG